MNDTPEKNQGGSTTQQSSSSLEQIPSLKRRQLSSIFPTFEVSGAKGRLDNRMHGDLQQPKGIVGTAPHATSPS